MAFIFHLFEVVVCTFADGVQRGANVVQDGQHARRSTAFDQLADDLIVEVVYRSPFDAFLYVFFLLCNEKKIKIKNTKEN